MRFVFALKSAKYAIASNCSGGVNSSNWGSQSFYSSMRKIWLKLLQSRTRSRIVFPFSPQESSIAVLTLARCGILIPKRHQSQRTHLSAQKVRTISARRAMAACPSGTHRYFFKLYALSEKLQLQPGASRQELEKAMEGKILGQTQLMGRYSK